MAPDDIGGVFTQRLRWAMGALQILIVSASLTNCANKHGTALNMMYALQLLCIAVQFKYSALACSIAEGVLPTESSCTGIRTLWTLYNVVA